MHPSLQSCPIHLTRRASLTRARSIYRTRHTCHTCQIRGSQTLLRHAAHKRCSQTMLTNDAHKRCSSTRLTHVCGARHCIFACGTGCAIFREPPQSNPKNPDPLHSTHPTPSRRARLGPFPCRRTRHALPVAVPIWTRLIAGARPIRSVRLWLGERVAVVSERASAIRLGLNRVVCFTRDAGTDASGVVCLRCKRDEWAAVWCACGGSAGRTCCALWCAIGRRSEAGAV